MNPTLKPPPTEVPLIHSVTELYKAIYILASQLPKRDRYGIWSKIESLSIEVLARVIEAAFAEKKDKSSPLKSARTHIEILKRLIRLAHQLKIITDTAYLQLETLVISISKQVSRWIISVA